MPAALRLLPRLARALRNRLAMKNKVSSSTGQAGYALLEIMALTAILMLSSGFVYTQNAALWRNYHKEQLRFVAQLLASDLRQLQQQSLFRVNAITRDLRASEAKNGYYLTEKGTAVSAVRFAEYACEDVYFASYIARLGFSQNGAPSSNGFYRLRHKQLANFGYQVDVQPITGRVLVYEIQ